MRNRMIVSLGAALLTVGQALAQPPVVTPSYLPPATSATPATSPKAADTNQGTSGSAAAQTSAPEFHSEVFNADPEDRANSGGQFWANGDYLLGWMFGNNLPPLVTSSPAGTARSSAGVLGSKTTSVLYGDNSVNDNLRSGIRVETGYWFDHGRDLNVGVEAGFSMLESQSSIFGTPSNGILARPYFNAADGTPQSVLIAYPGSSTGSVYVRASTGSYYDLNVDLTQRVWDGGWFKLDGLMGYRFFRYDEGLFIEQSLTPTNGTVTTGTQITTADSFVTHNEFNGGELGGRVQFQRDNWTLSLLGKLAIGDLTRTVAINGGQSITAPGAAPVVQTGGLYALSSNIGTYANNDWTILPEFGLNLAWRWNSHLQARIGYTVLYLDRIAHAADQVNFTVNPNLFPGSTTTGGPTQPAFTTPNRTDTWIQSINLGIEITF